MPLPRVLIVYGSTYGHTARIAARIRHLLTNRGFTVTMWRGRDLPPHFSLGDFDGVVVGASMIRRGYQKYIANFVRHHASVLNAKPSAFFAVSGSAGSKDEYEQAEAERLMHEFCAAHGWRPVLAASVAGAISYTKYNILLRWMMKRISKKEGGSTDTSRDYVYTDWAQVARFAEQFADRVDGAVHADAHEEPGLLVGA